MNYLQQTKENWENYSEKFHHVWYNFGCVYVGVLIVP